MSQGKKTEWTEAMLSYLTEHFPTDCNEEIAKKLKVSPRTMIRKARELGLQKAENFRELNEVKISTKMRKAHKGKKNPGCFKKGNTVGTEYRFKKGHQLTEESKEKQRQTCSRYWHIYHTKRSQKKGTKAWRQTWLNDAIRKEYGLKQETKFHYRYNALREYRERQKQQK